MIIGITGGVGAGKSTVLHMLKEEFAAKLYIADEYGHMALMPEYETFKTIVEMFGKDILDELGAIDREKMAKIVYSDDKKLKLLNSIIHPFVWDHIEADLKRNKEAELHIIESAILIESGYEEICDRVFGVFAPKEVRIKRLVETRGYSEEKAEEIMLKQMSEWELRSHCDAVIENDGNLEYLRKQLRQLLGK